MIQDKYKLALEEQERLARKENLLLLLGQASKQKNNSGGISSELKNQFRVNNGLWD